MSWFIRIAAITLTVMCCITAVVKAQEPADGDENKRAKTRDLVGQLAEELGEGIGAEFARNRDAPGFALRGRAWGPEQVTGAPDTRGAGDLQTAWASLSQDGQEEWLELSYKQQVVPTKVVIHETFNPGAVHKLTCFDAKGKEKVLWQGQPEQGVVGRRVLQIPIQTKLETKRIRVYLDSASVLGWNEIDAVGLVGQGVDLQWATDAKASSTFAEQPAQFAAGMQVVAPAMVNPFGGPGMAGGGGFGGGGLGGRGLPVDQQLLQKVQQREQQMASLIKRVRARDQQLLDQAQQFATERAKLLKELKLLRETEKQLRTEVLRLRESSR